MAAAHAGGGAGGGAGATAPHSHTTAEPGTSIGAAHAGGGASGNTEVATASVTIGMVIDVSGSMQTALEQAGQATTRGRGAFAALQRIVDIAKDEAARRKRVVSVFAQAVGTRIAGKDTCDALAALETAEALFLAQYPYQPDAAYQQIRRLAHMFNASPGEVAFWAERHFSKQEVAALVQYLLRNQADAKQLVALIPYAATRVALQSGEKLRDAHTWLADTLTAATTGDWSRRSRTTSSDTAHQREAAHPALAMARRFLELSNQLKLGRQAEDAVAAVMARIPEHATARSVTGAGELDLEESKVKAAVEMLKPHMYGSTPLGKGLRHARDEFRASSSTHKVLFILSDGLADYPVAAAAAATSLKAEGVTICCCFLTDQALEEPRTLHQGSAPTSWSKGARDLFDMASEVHHAAGETPKPLVNTEPPVSLLSAAGWSVPDEGVARLCFRANNLDVVHEFHTVVQTGLICGKTALDLANDIDWARFINVDVNSRPTVRNQHSDSNCWAQATATVVHLAQKRIVGRDAVPPLSAGAAAGPGGIATPPRSRWLAVDFDTIKAHLFRIMSARAGRDVSRCGQSVDATLQATLASYRLHSRVATEISARQAINHHRPCLATFCLRDPEWTKFTALARNGTVMTQENLRVPDHLCTSEPAGHAVVLIAVRPTYLEFLNSWGASWGMGGRFRVKDATVLRGLVLRDVYWYESDLVKEEKDAFKAASAKLREELRRDHPAVAEVLSNHEEAAGATVASDTAVRSAVPVTGDGRSAQAVPAGSAPGRGSCVVQ